MWEAKKRRAAAFRATFETPEGQRVLQFLRTFCRADYPTFIADDPHGRKSALAEGRREVWLMINGYLNLTDTQLRRMREEYPDA